MKTYISNRAAIEQLSSVTDFSLGACETIIEHYSITDDEYMFDPTQISEDWREYTKEEIMEEYGLTPYEFSNTLIHYYIIRPLYTWQPSSLKSTYLFTFGD